MGLICDMGLNMNHTKKKKQTIFLYFFLFVITFTQCTTKENPPSSPGSREMEYFTKLYKDSAHIAPSVVIYKIWTELEEIKDPLEKYKVHSFLSNSYYHANKLDSALIINQNIIDFCQSVSPTEQTILLEGEAYNNRGIFLRQMEQRDSAISCYKKAYELLNSIAEKKLLPDVCINLASCYYLNGDYIQTSNFYRHALFINDSIGLGDKLYSPIYSGLAQLYQELGNYDLAEECFQKAEQYWDSKTEREKYFFANTRGNFFYYTGKYPEALIWFRKAHTAALNQSLLFGQAIVESNLGEIFLLMEQTDSARYYLDHAKEILGSYYEQPSFKYYLDGLYASLALLENNLPEAEKLLLQPYDTLFITPSYIYSHNKRLQNLYEKKQDFRKAYHYQNIANAYNDSLRNSQIRNTILETDFRFQQDTTLLRKDLQLIESEYRIVQWKKATFLSIILFFLFVFIVTGIIIYRRRIRELRYQQQLNTITSLRMEVVRNRLSPHFMFNVLNAILPSLHKYEELEKPFRLLIQLLRNNLKTSGEIAISLQDEMKIVKDYIELQNLNHTHNIEVNWISGENLPYSARIPSMSIQIPVENAVKYAFDDTISRPQIQIRLSSDNIYLYLEIEDNGIGFHPGKHLSDHLSTGNGIKMLYRTIELLNSRNEKKIIFHIENLSDSGKNKQGTQISLIIPLNYNFAL